MAATVTKENDRSYFIKMYNLESYQLCFEEQVGGKPDSYIKLKEIEQNSTGDYFAIAYIDDGAFKLRTFGEETRADDEIAKCELDINDELFLDKNTMPIDNFPDPYITCCFINNDLIYCNLYHNYSCTHHSFVYEHALKKVTSH